MREQVKRKPGRPPLAQKQDKREVHLYIPADLAKRADERRGDTPMSAYILQLIEDDTRKAIDQ